jgi:hypothetical protein
MLLCFACWPRLLAFAVSIDLLFFDGKDSRTVEQLAFAILLHSGITLAAVVQLFGKLI